MRTDKRGDTILESRPAAPRSFCSCCDAPAYGELFCKGCVNEHGPKKAKKDSEGMRDCSFRRAESVAYAARIAAMPAPARRTYTDAFMGLEP